MYKTFTTRRKYNKTPRGSQYPLLLLLLLLLPVDISSHRPARGGTQHGHRAEECLPDMKREQGHPESEAASVKG